MESKQPEHGSRIEAASAENLAAMSEPYEQFKSNPVFRCTLEVCQRIGQNKGLNVSQVALMWALQKKFVSSVVLSVSSVEELENCMDILNKDQLLNQEEVNLILIIFKI